MIPLVGGVASRTSSAGGAASVALTTALAVLLNSAPTGAATAAVAGSRSAGGNRGSKAGGGGAADSAGGLAAAARASGNLGAAAGIHSGTGDDIVGHGTVDVDLDAGVGGLEVSGDGHSRGAGAAATGDGDLVAGHVWLSTTSTTGSVEGNGLGTEEVVTRGDVGWDLDVHLAAASVEILGAPEIIITNAAGGVLAPAIVKDLEPAGGTIGGKGVRDLGEVDGDGAVVGATNSLLRAAAITVLSVHLNSDGTTSADWALDLGSGADDVAAHVIGVIVGDGRVGLRKTGTLAAKVGSVNPELLEGGMGGGLLGQEGRQGGSCEGLHGC